MKKSRTGAETTIHLGFEVGTGEPVAIPLRHMAVTGMTQEAGKTTTLEALITRSALRAVTFITKRGEGAFAAGHRIPPYFRERADWLFVASLIDATLGEKNKILRAWLMKVCRGTKTLAEVQRNVKAAKDEARGFSESMYTEIEGYLDLVVPQLALLPPARAIRIGPGVNVMDLTAYSTELQALVIRSLLEHVYQHEDGVVVVIPEAWEFLPEGRGSPVKLAAETLIRKGAGLGNFMWLDSQDLGGVWKTALRACPVKLIGVQAEANEIKRTLDNIHGAAKPKKAEVAALERGQFFFCWGKHVIKTYVQPTWLDAEEARRVAVGDLPVEAVARPKHKPRREEATVSRDETAYDIGELAEHLANLTGAIRDLNARFGAAAAAPGAAADGALTEAAVRRIARDVATAQISQARMGTGTVDVPALAREVAKLLPKPEPGVDVDDIVRLVLARLPAGGVARVQVEPKEFVLKRFQQEEVERILQQAEGLTRWQKQVLCLIEAKGIGLQKSEVLKLITGKPAEQQTSTYKAKYEEIDGLADLGFLRPSGPRFFPNLAASIKSRLAGYNPTEQDVEEVIGQVLLRVNNAIEEE